MIIAERIDSFLRLEYGPLLILLAVSSWFEAPIQATLGDVRQIIPI